MDSSKNIDLALLRTFIAVAETGSLRAAGNAIEKTTSAVFYQIQRLEATLGRELLIRDKKKIRLSKAGYHFFSQAQALLQLNDKILSEN